MCSWEDSTFETVDDSANVGWNGDIRKVKTRKSRTNVADFQQLDEAGKYG
jgi:hypothetical protein